MKPDGLYVSQVYRWDRNSGGSTKLTAEYIDVPYARVIPNGEKYLKVGTSLNSIVKELPKEDAAVFQPFGILSVAVIPIFINGIFWGFTIFGDLRNERNFDSNIIEMMRSASFLFANALIRSEEAEKERKATQKQMDILKSMLNGLDTTICVTVPETGEILFINDSLKKQYGIEGDKTGQLCYKIFQDGMAERCDFCPHYKLKNEPTAVVEWEQLEPLINKTKRKTARLIDWPGGVKAHMEVAIDITAMKQAQAEAEHQAHLLHTVNQMLVILLESHTESFENDILRSMKIIADSVRVDRMYIWKNFVRNEKLYCSQVYEWSEGVASQKDYKLAKEALYSDVVPDWEERLSNGDCINGIVREMSDYEKAALGPQGILSILIVPIFIKNQFWGFVGFDDCHNERMFSDKEKIILISASHIIATALSRNDMERETTEKNELVRIIIEASPIGFAMFDDNMRVFDCNNTMINILEAPKQYFMDRFSDFFPEYQPDGRKSVEKAGEIMKYTFENEIVMTYEWVHKKLNGELIPCEITLTHAIHNGKRIGLVYLYDLSKVRNLEKNIKQLEKEVDKIYYDSLTGIYNRRYFDENLKHILKILSRSKGVISILMVDVDFFKDYNDTYGHGAGDKCLKIVAETLKNTIMRSDDFVARYGGEEFIIVLPNTDENGARLLARNMLRNVRNCNIPHSNSDVAEYVTISIGVATGIAENVNNWEDLVKSADEMLYKSKRNGRNGYSFISIC
jgi:diguanylate cyclase (GGDEF)-like protein